MRFTNIDIAPIPTAPETCSGGNESWRVAPKIDAGIVRSCMQSQEQDKIGGPPGITVLSGLSALADLHTGNWLALLGRVNFIQPVLLGIRVSEKSDPESYAAINLHFQGTEWRLSGIELPKPIARTLAASLPVK